MVADRNTGNVVDNLAHHLLKIVLHFLPPGLTLFAVSENRVVELVVAILLVKWLKQGVKEHVLDLEGILSGIFVD